MTEYNNIAKIWFYFSVATTIIALPLSPIFSYAQANETIDLITVSTDREAYHTGEIVVISGTVSEGILNPGEQLLLQVSNPQGALYRIDLVEVPANGTFRHELIVGGQLGLVGTYRVTASYNGVEAETTFQIEGDNVPEGRCTISYCSHDVNINGSSYPIRYRLSAYDLKSMEVDTESKTLLVFLERLEGVRQVGGITLELPHNIIDAKMPDGKRSAKFVISTGPSKDLLTETDYMENVGPGLRIITLTLPADAAVVQVAGTVIMPEFGSSLILVPIAAIVALTIATTRMLKSKKSVLCSK
jgi:hypothetical protein